MILAIFNYIDFRKNMLFDISNLYNMILKAYQIGIMICFFYILTHGLLTEK